MRPWDRPCSLRDAFIAGLPTYHGRPCQRCGGTLRKTRAMSCVTCAERTLLIGQYASVIADLKGWRSRINDTIIYLESMASQSDDRTSASPDSTVA